MRKSKNFSKWKSGQKIFPSVIELLITNICNCKCRYCDGGANFKSHTFTEPVSKETFEQVTKDALHLGVETFQFSGSEPTMRKDLLLSLVKKIKQKDKRVLISTNGTLLTKKDIEYLVDCGCDEILVSLDSEKDDIHDNLRGMVGVTKRVKKILELFKKLKTENNTMLPMITLNTVITSANCRQLKDLVIFAHEKEVQQILFEGLLIQTDDCRSLCLGKDDRIFFQKSINSIEKMQEEFEIMTNINVFREEKYIQDASCSFNLMKDLGDTETEDISIPCYDPWFKIVILHDGRVGPCIGLAEISNTYIGNTPLEDIWSGPFFEGIRKKMSSGDYPDRCNDCKVCTNKITEKGR